jgi:tetratricopeptide (TPR) repeat protein
LLFGAVILLVPVAQARREGQPMRAPLLAALVPIVLIGLALMLYNAMRFGNPFEFGLHYQLHAERRMARQFFSLHHLWFNFRVYFLEPVRWMARSPFMKGIVVPPVPWDQGNVESPFGILTTIPFVWLALAAPLAWRDRSERAGWVLRWFMTAVALLFGIVALTLGLYYCTAGRFEVEFLPALLLLAVVGILGLERALANQPVRRRVMRWSWGLLLGFSVAFNLLAGVEYRGEVQTVLGNRLFRAGKVSEAFGHYQQAVEIDPDSAEAHNNLGTVLARTGKIEEAIVHFEQALRIKPESAEAHYNLGVALARADRLPEAIEQLEEAVRITPESAEAQCGLGIALGQAGRIGEAVGHLEQALRIKPDFTQAQIALERLQARQSAP